jgi:hypothetical protein
MIPLLVALALPALPAVAAVRVGWPVPRLGRADRALLVCWGAGGGLGLASCALFLWFPLIGHPASGYVTAEVLTLLALAALVFRRVARLPAPAGPVLVTNPPPSALAAKLWIPFAVLAALAVRHVLSYYAVEPHGYWDAIAFWNTRARCLYRGGGAWRDAFSTLHDHPDYPLFLPATVTRCWLYAGEDTTGPIAVALLTAALTAGVLVAGLNLLRGGGQGWLAGAALLGPPLYAGTVGIQYADVPLGYFFVAAAAAFVAYDHTGRTGRLFPTLAGGFAALAAWTKNEGVLFLAAVPAARLAAALVGPGVRSFVRELRWFALGALPAGLTLLYFKLAFAPPNDLLSAERPSTVGLLTDWKRHETILRTFGAMAWAHGRFVLPVLLAYALLAGRAPAGRRPPGAPAAVALLALMAAGYYLAYLTTPHDLVWHIGTSMERLVIQLWPLALLCYFLAVATPDEARGK